MFRQSGPVILMGGGGGGLAAKVFLQVLWFGSPSLG